MAAPGCKGTSLPQGRPGCCLHPCPTPSSGPWSLWVDKNAAGPRCSPLPHQPHRKSPTGKLTAWHEVPSRPTGAPPGDAWAEIDCEDSSHLCNVVEPLFPPAHGCSASERCVVSGPGSGTGAPGVWNTPCPFPGAQGVPGPSQTWLPSLHSVQPERTAGWAAVGDRACVGCAVAQC